MVHQALAYLYTTQEAKFVGGGRIAEAPPGNHIRPEGLRTGRPQLTAGHGRPVCQPWWTGDKAGEQRPEAMNFAGLLLSTIPKYLNPEEPKTYSAGTE